MPQEKSFDPVIIIGMHRSGTSMISQLLEKIGLFLGAKKEQNNEARFFLKINNWVLQRANSTWDNPYNFYFINENYKNHMLRVINKQFSGIRRSEYLGWKKYLKYKNIKDLDFQWGWKDPRTTITYCIWHKIFPNSKIVHIYRNPIDVAQSLRKRSLDIQANFKLNLSKKLKESFIKGKIKYCSSYRALHLAECYKLWEEYVTKAFEIEEKYNKRILHIKYEDFINNAFEELKDLASFIGLQHVSDNKINQIIKNVKSDRCYVFKKDQKLCSFYLGIKDNTMLKKLDYDNIKLAFN
jgi:hypothetical protein